MSGVPSEAVEKQGQNWSLSYFLAVAEDGTEPRSVKSTQEALWCYCNTINKTMSLCLAGAVGSRAGHTWAIPHSHLADRAGSYLVVGQKMFLCGFKSPIHLLSGMYLWESSSKASCLNFHTWKVE